MLKGIDVSEHQGVIDWNKVKDHVDFAILRAGWGNNHIDKQFIRNIKECNRLNIPCGAYWFSYALNADMAKREARFLLDAVKSYRIEYPLFCDWEGDSKRYAEQEGINITKRLCTDIAKAFLSEIEGAGYWASNYANPNFINNYFYQSELERYSLWLAWYGAKESQAKSYGCEMWQFTESGSIPGIGTNSVDINYDYRNFEKAIRDKGLNRLDNSKPVSRPSKTSYKLVPQTGTCTIVVNKLNIREEPSTDSDIVGAYYEDEQVSYDYYVDNEGYRWISWIGASGKRRYMAVRVLDTNKRYGKCV
ncbi:GH25 family lysozyme [Clostridium sp. Ade.TY]|uniref:GH25 family lysozyme n=1 Tax=Clostridium sp. Ade.TY TaxID=1391647 RepID=UPI0003FE44DD|nr:GH25 family lysozyme [Clostridium sp. Ade.TY]